MELPQQNASPKLGYGTMKRRRRPWREISIWGSIPLLFVTALILIPFSMRRQPGHEFGEVCRSNLRTIGAAIEMHAEEHQGVTPPDFATLFTTEDVSARWLVCPSSPADQAATGATTQEIIADFRKPGHCSYVYAGAGLNLRSLPATFVLVYEYPSNHNGGGGSVLYANGQAEFTNKKKLDHIHAEITVGHNPPR